MNQHSLICENPACKKAFKALTLRRRYCQKKCWPSLPTRLAVRTDPSSTGAISELRVAVDLLSKGYEVFRALSPSASCDLLALRNGKVLRVESRTSVYRRDGTRSAKKPLAKDAGRQDVFAWVLPDRVQYEPPLEAVSA
jgi:hypothetical protein